jgi:hypothetical protein
LVQCQRLLVQWLLLPGPGDTGLAAIVREGRLCAAQPGAPEAPEAIDAVLDSDAGNGLVRTLLLLPDLAANARLRQTQLAQMLPAGTARPLDAGTDAGTGAWADEYPPLLARAVFLAEATEGEEDKPLSPFASLFIEKAVVLGQARVLLSAATTTLLQCMDGGAGRDGAPVEAEEALRNTFQRILSLFCELAPMFRDQTVAATPRFGGDLDVTMLFSLLQQLLTYCVGQRQERQAGGMPQEVSSASGVHAFASLLQRVLGDSVRLASKAPALFRCIVERLPVSRVLLPEVILGLVEYLVAPWRPEGAPSDPAPDHAATLLSDLIRRGPREIFSAAADKHCFPTMEFRAFFPLRKLCVYWASSECLSLSTAVQLSFSRYMGYVLAVAPRDVFSITSPVPLLGDLLEGTQVRLANPADSLRRCAMFVAEIYSRKTDVTGKGIDFGSSDSSDSAAACDDQEKEMQIQQRMKDLNLLSGEDSGWVRDPLYPQHLMRSVFAASFANTKEEYEHTFSFARSGDTSEPRVSVDSTSEPESGRANACASSYPSSLRIVPSLYARGVWPVLQAEKASLSDDRSAIDVDRRLAPAIGKDKSGRLVIDFRSHATVPSSQGEPKELIFARKFAAKAPTYLSQALDALRNESDFETAAAALCVLPRLVRRTASSPDLCHQLLVDGPALLRTLLGLDNRFNLPDFPMWRFSSLVAITSCIAPMATLELFSVFFGQDQSEGTKLEALDAVVAAARELNGIDPPIVPEPPWVAIAKAMECTVINDFAHEAESAPASATSPSFPQRIASSSKLAHQEDPTWGELFSEWFFSPLYRGLIGRPFTESDTGELSTGAAVGRVTQDVGTLKMDDTDHIPMLMTAGCNSLSAAAIKALAVFLECCDCRAAGLASAFSSVFSLCWLLREHADTGIRRAVLSGFASCIGAIFRHDLRFNPSILESIKYAATIGSATSSTMGIDTRKPAEVSLNSQRAAASKPLIQVIDHGMNGTDLATDEESPEFRDNMVHKAGVSSLGVLTSIGTRLGHNESVAHLLSSVSTPVTQSSSGLSKSSYRVNSFLAAQTGILSGLPREQNAVETGNIPTILDDLALVAAHLGLVAAEDRDDVCQATARGILGNRILHDLMDPFKYSS